MRDEQSLLPRSLPAGEVHAWHTGLDAPAPRIERLAARLTPAERDRAARFYRERGRRRYVVAHAFLRALLGRYLGCPPEAVPIEAGGDGKPRLAGPGALRFSLAHSGELALAAFAVDRDVGADVERVRALRAGPGLARRVLTERELAELSTEADFFSCWTRKEAVLKASGEGLRRDPATVEVGTGAAAEATLVRLAGGGGAQGPWSVVSLAPAEGYVAAVAARGAGLRPRMVAWAPEEWW